MTSHSLPLWALWTILTGAHLCCADDSSARPLAGTAPLALDGDLSVRMRAGFAKYLRRELDAAVADRRRHWQRDVSSPEAYERSVAPKRARLRTMIGVVDPRLPVSDLEVVGSLSLPRPLVATANSTVDAVRWPVLEGVFGEGLLLQPLRPEVARVVVLPDADQTPEQLAGLAPGLPAEQQLARRLAERGCLVVVPALLSRDDAGSGNPAVAMTNQTHREWIYRMAYTFGRHVIGYEVQKCLALVDWLGRDAAVRRVPIGVAGYGEGGLVALYSAAVDPRIDAALVSGYFNSRQELAEEPVYRNVFGLLTEFGDAEIASLVFPRALVIEHSPAPEVVEPRPAKPHQRAAAAPGRITTPPLAVVQAEADRAQAFFPQASAIRPSLRLISGNGPQSTTGLGSDAALAALFEGLRATPVAPLPQGPLPDRLALPDAAARQMRQLRELEERHQRLLRVSAGTRERFWKKADASRGAAEWPAQSADYRDHLWDQVISRFPPPSLPANARTRQALETPRWTAYEVVLDVYPEVICWGWLLVPQGIPDGERRPVVVCQHGLEGVPADTVTRDPQAPGYGPYKGFSAALADRGFVVYAPHNYYRGGNDFRQLQRLANPLGKTLFGITTIQHQRHLEWLGTLPFVDPGRIAFYGLSYGGNTAMRVPALLTQYAAVICSGDFNEWIHKSVSIDSPLTFMYYPVYEVWEWNLGHTYNHGDLAALIAPRPFMVERGHTDGVAIDEWVAAEYARVRRLYAVLGIPERTEIEFFNGPHTINGQGTFEFLHRHLQFPPPGQ